jgi:hypothetical protein
MTLGRVVCRPVWHPDDHAAVSHETIEHGEAIYGRGPDAWGAYFIEPDGRLKHLFDTPADSLPAAEPR